jgi:hypothetical protein
LDPVRALETNVFHRRSWREADLAKEDRTTEVFDFLLTRLVPRVVFVHGRSAVKHLQRLTGAQIECGVFNPVRYQGVAFDLYAGHHLSYHWSYAKVQQLGRELRSRCHSSEVNRAEPDGV